MKKNDRADERLSMRVIPAMDLFSSFVGYMPNPDEVLRDSGERITVYREMRTDPRIKSLLALLKSSVLEFVPRIEQAEARPAVLETVQKNLHPTLLYGLEKRLLSAVEYGYSVVELVWENQDGWWVVEDVVLRKPERFVFDVEGRLKYKDTLTGELIDLYDQPYKWLVYRYDKDAENPYGTSALKSCYWAWKFKKAGSQFWILAAEKFSVPSILALFDTSEPEDRVRERALRLSELLSTVQSGSGAALANIKEVKLLTSPEKVSEFRSLMEWCDQQISYGITGQSLATQEAEYGSRSQASVHRDVLKTLAKGICRELSEALQRLVSYVVELNYGPGEWQPQVRFDLDEHATWDELVQAIDRGIPVSRAELYSRYGLPQPAGEEDVFLKPGGQPQDLLSLAMADTESKKKSPQAPLLELEADERTKLAELDRLAERARALVLPLIGKAVARWIASLSSAGTAPGVEVLRGAPFPDTEPELIRRTEQVLAAALLEGMDHAGRGQRLTLADETEYHPLPFEEAIHFLKARVSLTKAEWQALEPKLAFRAFTLAKLTSCDYIEAVRGRLIHTLEKGEGFERAWADVKAIAESEGATLKPGYWETVYRTNIQTAYNAGRRMQFDRAKPRAYALMVLEDERTSSICRPLVGLVLPADHPFWEDHWPPFHFNCRTTVRGIYEEEIAQVPVQNLSMAKLRKTFKPQEGFGGNPIKSGSFYELTDEMAKRALRYGIMKDLKDFADKAGFRSVRLYNPESLEGFELVQEYPSGGKLYKHESYKGKKLPEEPIAQRLAGEGRMVKLLPRSDLLKSPDLMVDGEVWEVKTPTAGTKNSIVQALRTKQSDNIILYLPDALFDDAKTLSHDRVNRGKASLIWIITPLKQEMIRK